MLRPRTFAARSAKQDRDRARHEARSVLALAVPAPAPKAARRRMGRRVESRRSSYFADPSYLAWLREQPCGVRAFAVRAGIGLAHECSPTIDPEHRREGVGAGQRAADPLAWACCRRHHDQRHDGRGFFADVDRDAVRVFVRERIAEAQAAYYGRALSADDLLTVRAAVEAGRSTHRMFATAGETRQETAA